MAFDPTSPVTGGAQTGLTSPTFTIVNDQNPADNGKQVYVSALGGTQSGVLVHSVSSPFTASMFRPKVLKTLQPVNPVTGVLRSVPTNDYKIIIRKGVIPLAGQAPRTANITITMSIPAGAEANDYTSLESMFSFMSGLCVQIPTHLLGSVKTGSV